MVNGIYSRRSFLRLSALGSAGVMLGIVGCSNGQGSSSSAASASASSSASAAITLNDNLFGPVEIPGEAFRVVSTAPAYTVNILLVGAGEKIVGLDSSTVANEWLLGKYPYLKDVPAVVASSELNIETVLERNPDLVALAPSYKEAAYDRLKSAGVTCISSPNVGDAGLLESDKQLSVYFANAIGGSSIEKGKVFAEYFDGRVKAISKATEKLADADRPRVLYLNALDPLEVSNGNTRSMPHAWIGPAGGVNVASENTDDVKSGVIEVSMEQVFAWNPEIVFCPNANLAEQVRASEAWANVAAVENDKVIASPSGLMPWYANGPEMALMLDFAAKVIQPELFGNIDMRKTAETFYKDMFGFDIDESDLQRFFGTKESIDQYLANLFA